MSVFKFRFSNFAIKKHLFKGLVNPNNKLILIDRKQKDKQDCRICWNQKYLGKSIFGKMYQFFTNFIPAIAFCYYIFIQYKKPSSTHDYMCMPTFLLWGWNVNKQLYTYKIHIYLHRICMRDIIHA